MIGIKIMVALATLIIGGYYSRKELKAMKELMFEREYMNLAELKRIHSRMAYR
ncbi:hypothetical protein JXC34_02715 [Candidatus Woesearchaeota archaeon]|nr:hypothetical protein [Candidatus Woesearchaeota archaeon]